MHVGLIGVTGEVGSKMLQALIDNKKVKKITCISRKFISVGSDKAKLVFLSVMSPETISNIKLKCDVYICTLGSTIKKAKTKQEFIRVDHDMVVAFSHLARRNDAKGLFVVSASTANKNSQFFYSRVKGKMEESVSKLSIRSVYFLRPSLLICKRTERRLAETIGVVLYETLRKGFSKSLLSKLGTEVDDIVNYVSKEISNPKKGIHYVTRFE